MNVLAAVILALWVNVELERCCIIVQYSSISLSLAVSHDLRITLCLGHQDGACSAAGGQV